jgi:hypothetical protein
MRKAVPYGIIALLLGVLFYQSSEIAKLEAIASASRRVTGKKGDPSRSKDPGSPENAETEREELEQKMADQAAELSKLREENRQLPKLQAEVARLQGLDGTEGSEPGRRMNKAGIPSEEEDPFASAVMSLARAAADLNRQVQSRTAFEIPELQLLEEADWLSIAKNAKYDNDEAIRQTLSKTRQKAKSHFAELATEALNQYYAANNNQPPANPTQLLPFFKDTIDPSILQRYQMIPSAGLGSLPELGPMLISERAPVDRQYDTHFYIGRKGVASFTITPAGSTDPDVTWATR